MDFIYLEMNERLAIVNEWSKSCEKLDGIKRMLNLIEWRKDKLIKLFE